MSAEKKDTNLIVRISEDEKERIKNAAAELGMTVSQYLRTVAEQAMENCKKGE